MTTTGVGPCHERSGRRFWSGDVSVIAVATACVYFAGNNTLSPGRISFVGLVSAHFGRQRIKFGLFGLLLKRLPVSHGVRRLQAGCNAIFGSMLQGVRRELLFCRRGV